HAAPQGREHERAPSAVGYHSHRPWCSPCGQQAVPAAPAAGPHVRYEASDTVYRLTAGRLPEWHESLKVIIRLLFKTPGSSRYRGFSLYTSLRTTLRAESCADRLSWRTPAALSGASVIIDAS